MLKRYQSVHMCRISLKRATSKTNRRELDRADRARVREAAREKLLESGLALGETPGSVLMCCNHPRYQALAWLIKRNTNAGHEWVTRELDMGHLSNVSRTLNATCTYARTDPLA